MGTSSPATGTCSSTQRARCTGPGGADVRWWLPLVLVYVLLASAFVWSILAAGARADEAAEREYDRFIRRGAGHQPDQGSVR